MISIMNTLEKRERKPLIRAAIDAHVVKLEARASRRLRLRKADDARRAPEEDGP